MLMPKHAKHDRVARLLSWALVLLASSALADRPYRGGAVATQHAWASQAALEMLERGGNAVDAAVAAAFTLAVATPYHSGLGGGGFALVYDAKTSQARVLDFRETAPRAATRDMYLKDGAVVPGLSTDGALAVATPGAAAGYLELLAHGGRLKPEVVMAPAIRAARIGIWVSPKYRQMASARVEALRRDPEAARLFLRPGADGVPAVPPIGTLLPQPELAGTLEQLAKRGAGAFYAGALGRAVAEAVKKGGGVMTFEDIAGYHPRWRQPLEGTYRGHRIVTAPLPSAGGVVVLETLGMLEAATPQGFDWHDAGALHVLAEALQRAHADRAQYLGDPAFVDVPLQRLLSSQALSAAAGRIPREHATASSSLVDGGTGLETDIGSLKHTSHISVVDREGNAVALTTTLNGPFGAALVVKGTGIVLNNQMDDFDIKPSAQANAIAPGKVPLSSVAPTFVFQKTDPSKVMLALGAAGGPFIPSTVVQLISNVVDARMDLVRAVGAGRIHHPFLPDVLLIDRFGVDPATEKALQALGHATHRVEAWADAEAVYVDPETALRTSASEPRFDGASAGQD